MGFTPGVVLGVLLSVAGLVVLVYGFRLYGQPRVGEQISVWRTVVPVLDEPAEHFYTRLYQSLKASLQERLPDSGGRDREAPVEIVLTGMGFGPHRLFATPSIFSERPVYLLVRYQHLRCYIYAGQTPTGLFVSSWGYSDCHIGEGPNQRRAFSRRAWKYFSRQTLFQFDAAIMFTDAVHELLSDTVNTYRDAKGLQPLEALERRPILHAFYQNPFSGSTLYGNPSSGNPINGNPMHGNPLYRDSQIPVSHMAPVSPQSHWAMQPVGSMQSIGAMQSIGPMQATALDGHRATASNPQIFSHQTSNPQTNTRDPNHHSSNEHSAPSIPRTPSMSPTLSIPPMSSIPPSSLPPMPQPLFDLDTPAAPQPLDSTQPIASTQTVASTQPDHSDEAPA